MGRTLPYSEEEREKTESLSHQNTIKNNSYLKNNNIITTLQNCNLKIQLKKSTSALI